MGLPKDGSLIGLRFKNLFLNTAGFVVLYMSVLRDAKLSNNVVGKLWNVNDKVNAGLQVYRFISVLYV